MNSEEKTHQQLLQELEELRRLEAARGGTESALNEFSVSLVQGSATPTFVIDLNHRVVVWNKACEHLTGIKAADIIGTDNQWQAFYDHKRPVLADLIVDQNTGTIHRHYHTYARSKYIPEGLQAEGWYPNINGVERYISFNAAPIKNRRGELLAAIETFDDLTESKQAQKKLAENEKRYRTLFEESPAVMLIVDPGSAKIVSANDSAIMFYGYSKTELFGKAMTEIIDLPSEQTLRMLSNPTQGTSPHLLRHRLADGEIRDVECSRALITVEDQVYMFLIVQDVTARKAAEAAHRDGEAKLQAITSLAADAIILVDNAGKVAFWNVAAERMFGYDQAEMIGRDLDILIPQQYKEAHAKGFTRFAETGLGPMVGKVYEVTALRRDGSEFPVELSISGLMLKGKWHSAGVVRDITERRNLENQLRHAQKMEAIGTLAGGIAHDFNNILMAIIGFASLLSMKMNKNDPSLLNVNQILAAADRASELTRSLLAFSRKTPLETRAVSLNGIVSDMETLLARLLRENIEFKTTLTDAETTVMADASQLEQVLTNLVVNARDAMPNGGRLLLSTEFVELDREFIRIHGYGVPGPYVSLTCSDTGIGMDKETTQRIFEPFFTTKETGKGTGLGLAVVYGIIKQHKGFINCYSEPGLGTSFRIFLPLTQALPDAAEAKEETVPKGGNETILVAEDDTSVRTLVKEVLESFGYSVIEAVNGEEAVRLFVERKAEINLVMLDVIMPKMSGRQACDKIQQVDPEIKCLFTSGYAVDIFAEEERKLPNFLPKPVVPIRLLLKIREILDKE